MRGDRKRTAILIGVDRYDDPAFPDLKSPSADVKAIKKSLEQNGHFRVKSLPPDPTYTDAIEALDEVFTDSTPNDLVFVSFSGHGMTDKHGNLHLLLRDSRPNRLMSTAISAQKLQGLLRDTRADGKVLLLDCCHSGAFADGFGTRSADDEIDAIDVGRQLKDAKGTYVMAASGATQKAHEGDNSSRVQPSVFSAAVAHGLAGHAGDADGDGWIDPTDLNLHVERALEGDGRQRTTVFTDGLQGRIQLARHIGSATATPLASPGGESAEDGAAGATTTGPAPLSEGARRPARPDAPFDADQWRSLLGYYRSCLERESLLQQLPKAQGKWFAPCVMGTETLLSGAETRWRATGRAANLAREAHRTGQSLRYGYPAVLVDVGRSTVSRGQRDRRVAPLIAMDVEAKVEGDAVFLVPVGEPQLNEGLLRTAADLPPDAVAELVAAFEADWGGQGVAGLGDKARTLLHALGLPREDLKPGALGDDVVVQFRPAGAQNVAMVHVAEPASGAVGGLVADLAVGGKWALKVEDIHTSALGALTASDRAASPGTTPSAPAFRPVITGPGNDSQEKVRIAAMTRRLTVATGAPGTGKSELITSIVTTAVAAGESVLVASTNNEAVDVVVKRVNGLLPQADLIVRSGNRDFRKNEPGILDRMLSARFERVDAPTAAERIDAHERRIARARQAINDVAEAERELAVLAPVWRREADRLPAGVSVDAFGDAAEVRRWMRRVDGALESRWTGWWHRRRTGRALGIPPEKDALIALGRFLNVHAEWLDASARAGDPDDARREHARIAGIREESRGDARAYLTGRVAQALTEGRGAIEARLRVLAGEQSSWSGMQRLLRSVRAWATTSRSARVFPPNAGLFDLVVIDEAGQCTVADLVPLLYRAKRALVIGDPHQIQPIHALKDHEDRTLQERAGLDSQWLDDRSLVFSKTSAYLAAASAVAASGGEVLWLDEHYRCHPDIVRTVNRRFYGGRLQIRTDPGRLAVRGGPAIEWIDVRGETDRPGGYSCRNQEEAAAVVKLVWELGAELPPEAGIGVVSPFSMQVRHLKEILGDRAGERIKVGTAHTFQGKERDVIVVSPTAAEGVLKRSGDWADREQTLWNVAVTRAKSRLYIVGDRGYWAARDGLLGDIAAAGTPGPAPEEPGARDEARAQLFTALLEAGADPRRSEPVDGYTAGITVPTAGGGEVAVIIDRAGIGDPNAGPAGRGLQRALDHAALFEAVSGIPTIRVPAWRCFAEPDTLAAEIIGR
ncbi:AAA domain-containing protein [Nocardiopsis mangrovi]|uniref:AAA domain-containing protein n=1 Tax=Nocardiopsis mangrovi TaxID=1179818 RepID=A0ABV9DVB4_9ACTN